MKKESGRGELQWSPQQNEGEKNQYNQDTDLNSPVCRYLKCVLNMVIRKTKDLKNSHMHN